MSKLAQTHFPVHPFIQNRWSPRAFANRPVEATKIGSLLEAARWAASSRNEQPWRFIIASKENEAEFSRLQACLMDGNAKWAKEAPLLILVVAQTISSYNNQPNGAALHDVGLAMGNLSTQATAMDLYLHMMGGFHRETARETYQIPDGYDPVVMVAIGYLGDPADLPGEGMREREQAARARQPLAEMVFQGTWGQTAPLVAQSEA